MNTDSKAHVTYALLKKFIEQPGQLDFHVHHLQGHYIPFAFFTPPNAEQIGYGPIVSDGALVAAIELADLTAALRESFGDRVRIFAQGGLQSTAPAPRILH